jgi:uncharacterized protein YecE (DUF72 family)
MAGYFVGTSGWTYDRWKGDFFPLANPGSIRFGRYASRYSAVEVNGSFYHAACDSGDMRWREQGLPGFRYALKVPKSVTHHKQLANVESEISIFWRTVCHLDERLGMILLQLSPDQPMDLGWLQAVLKAFGDPSRVAVEFRAPAWQGEDVRRQLEHLGAAHVSVDSPHHQLTEWITGPRAYIRLHGRRRWFADCYTPEELEGICELAHRMDNLGAQEIYIFFNNTIEGNAQENALALKHMLA